MKRQKIITVLTPFWREYLEKKGRSVLEQQVKIFKTETEKIQKVNWVTIVTMLTHPYYLSYYVSFVRNRRKVRKSFWRFSAVLYKMRIAYENQTFSAKEWDDFLSQYIQGTLESENRESNLLVLSEVLQLVDH